MLDEYQKKAVSHGEGPCLVIAGPGSGKTKCIVERINHLVACGTHKDRILVITFTRDAAAEMEQRYLKDAGSFGVHFSTFHSLFYHILSDRYGSDMLRSVKMPRVQMTEHQPPIEPDNIEGFYDSLGKNTKDLFINEPETLKKWQYRFSHILVDEYQDINEEQYEILVMLLGERRNLFAVGDDDQSIYSFRGSDPSFMTDFKSYFPDAKEYLLLNNYRSCRQIVTAAKNLIDNNVCRYKKDIRAYSDGYGRVEYRFVYDEKNECQLAYDMIKKVLSHAKDDTVGVLFRNRHQSKILSEVLTMEKIPFYIKDKNTAFDKHFIYRDILSMLFLSYDMGDDTDELRAAQCFGQKYRKFADTAGRLSPFAAANYLCKGAGYDDHLKHMANGNKLYENELMRIRDKVCSSFIGLHNRDDLLKYKNESPVIKSEDIQARVGLYTFHGAKGLEFDHVIILDVNEGVTPSSRAKEDTMEEERRMFYVAITRAKKSIFVISTKSKKGRKMYPSRFIAEMQDKKDKNDVFNR